MKERPAFRRDDVANPASIVLIFCVVAVAGVVAIQASGASPCEFCLKERLPYFFGAVLAAATLVAIRKRWHSIIVVGFIGLDLIFFCSTCLGLYHVGVEYKIWAPAEDCTRSTDIVGSFENVLKLIQRVSIARCDTIPVKLLGLSLACWNTLLSIVLSVTASVGIWIYADEKQARRLSASLPHWARRHPIGHV